MSLTDITVKKAKPKEKIYFLSDGRGLMLEVRPSGGKSWVARLRVNGKETRRVIGGYPDISISEAREECMKLKKEPKIDKSISFRQVYDEWYRIKIMPLSEKYQQKLKIRIHKHVLPFIGDVPIAELKSSDMLAVCRRAERLSTDTAHRVRQINGQIFRYAIAAGYIENDPTYALRGALSPHRQTHYAAITDPKRISILMRSIVKRK